MPGDLEVQIGNFIEHHNLRRYHESLENLALADVYFGRAPEILAQRQHIKRQTIQYRCLLHQKNAV